MSIRRLEASRPVPIPASPYELVPAHLPFGMVFARTTIARSRFGEGDESEDDPPKPPKKPEPTWSNAETTTFDGNDPSNDEEIDWLQDD
jgi:hypothetical protein